MQSGEYITDRWMVKLIAGICQARAIGITRFSDDWLLRLSKDDKYKFIIGYKFGINDAAAASIAQDKVATYELLAASGVAATPHYLARTKAASDSGWKVPVGNDFVTKPLVGTSGHGVRRFSSANEATEWMKQSGIEAWAVSPFVDITRETRLIILDGQVMVAYEKQPVEIHGLRMFNLGKGATATDITADDSLVTLAKQSMQALGLRLAAVDVIEDSKGDLRVLEINEGIMMENYMRQSSKNKQRAYDVYDAIVQRMME